MLLEPAPSFFLYEEPPRSVSDQFVHVELLDDRTRPSNWNIRLHSHDNLHQVFNISSGGGRMSVDGEVLEFSAPALLLVPARTTHGFNYEQETTGAVLTLSASHFDAQAAFEPAFLGLFERATALDLSGEADRVLGCFRRLTRELAWNAPAHDAAVVAQLLDVLVTAVRLKHRAQPEVRSVLGRDAQLVARFREQVEIRYRLHTPVEEYAEAMAVSASRLRAACLRTTGKPPIDLIQERLLLEAKRSLIYGGASISEVAYSLGFEDTSYFSRFFSKKEGCSPRQFRAGSGSGV